MTIVRSESSKLTWFNINATKAVASTFAILVGMAGIEHGILEILQGYVANNIGMIDAVGPNQKVWEYSTEPALTIIPNLLITGLLAIIMGIFVIIWTVKFIDEKHGAGFLFVLSVILWLFGGGFAPIFMSILASATATRINKPLNWWRTHLPVKLHDVLARLWPWSIITYIIVFTIGVEIAVVGYPLLWLFDSTTTYSIQVFSAFIMVILWPVSIITAFAFDIRKKSVNG